MTGSEKQEALVVENKMFKAYKVVRIIGLILWAIGMMFTGVSLFFEETAHAVLYLIGTFGLGWGIVLLFVSSDIDLIRQKKVFERTEAELQNRLKEYKETQEEEKKEIKKVSRKVTKKD